MALPRTRTLQTGDLVFSCDIRSTTTTETYQIPCPINGYVERVLVAKGASHSAGESYFLTTAQGSQFPMTGSSGGSAGDVDAFELGSLGENFQDSFAVQAGASIELFRAGTPATTAPGSIMIVVKGN